MAIDQNPVNDLTTAAPTTRHAIGRRLVVVATGAVMALGVGGVAYAATTTSPTPSTSTTTPDEGSATVPDDGTATTPGEGPGNGEPCDDAGTGSGTTSPNDTT